MKGKKYKFGTLCTHAGEHVDPLYHSHTAPIYQTSAFVMDNSEQSAAIFSGEQEGYAYRRLPPNTPTHTVLVVGLGVKL